MAQNRAMEHNKSPISIRNGKIFVDGIEIADSVNGKIEFEPIVSEATYLSDDTPSNRWIGYKITGQITQYRSTSFIGDMVKKYQQTKKTPEFTVQMVNTDENSDYYAAVGNMATTVVGCVPTGKMTLLELDASGDTMKDNIPFSARKVV